VTTLPSPYPPEGCWVYLRIDDAVLGTSLQTRAIGLKLIHFDMVDEAVADDDTTYISMASTTVGIKNDLFHIPDTAIPVGATINNVTVYFRHRGTALTIERCAARIKTYGTEYAGSDKISGTTYVTSSETWSTNPNTLSAWTIDEINALQIGVTGRRGEYYDPDLEMWFYDATRCTQIFIIITYTIVAARSPVGDGLTWVQ